MRDEQYVILEWIEELPHFPRYGFATIAHAEELGDKVRWHQRCRSLGQADASVRALNQHAAMPAIGTVVPAGLDDAGMRR